MEKEKLPEKENITVLSVRDRDRLIEILEDDSEPNEALKKAAEIHKKLIISDEK